MKERYNQVDINKLITLTRRSDCQCAIKNEHLPVKTPALSYLATISVALLYFDTLFLPTRQPNIMPLRPIDALFIHPKQRLYVVYYRGELWQLPRMKIDDKSWQNRRLYTNDSRALYLSSCQIINDPVLAQKLRTLNLPTALHGCTLSQFEAWWETHGFKWFKDTLTMGQSPLAAHQTVTPTTAIDNQPTSPSNYQSDLPRHDNSIGHKSTKKIIIPYTKTDIFAEMLADLVNEVLYQKF